MLTARKNLVEIGGTLGLCVALSMHAAPVNAGGEQQPERQATARDSAASVVGPMVGAVTQRSARVWAQLTGVPNAEPADVWVEYWPEGRSSGGGTTHFATDRFTTAGPRHWTVHIPLDRLEPGTRYQYQVKWKSASAQGASAVASVRTESLWQYRTDPPPVRVLAGSCAYTNDPRDDRPGTPYGRSPVIFQSMAERGPDLTLWMGDNIYLREPDFGDETAMSSRYDKWRALPEMQTLLRQGRHVATWDDHDYGPNDSNSSYVHKDKSLKLFQRYWGNPSYGLPGVPGVFTSHTISDAEFFLIDNRWYRDSDRLADEDRRMLGVEQMRWLRNALLASTATWKFIVSGSQVLNLTNQFEGWNRFPRESQEFFDWLEKQKIPGVIFLSGDRHFSVMLKMDRTGTYPLYELTCSPLTAGAYENPVKEIVDNPRLLSGSAVTRNSFCELDFSGAKGARKLSISIRAADNQLQWSREIQEAELR